MLKDSNTWTWRTVEGDTGEYYTYTNGAAIFFMRDSDKRSCKICTVEKFKVCKTPSGTRKKLNRMFADKQSDPDPDNPWRF